MNRFDRILGILLFLRGRPSVSAADLARHFEVSTRTMYRDVQVLSALLVKAERILGFEKFPHDIFHPEPAQPLPTIGEQKIQHVSTTMSAFFQALLDGHQVLLRYHSPYQEEAYDVQMEPLGLLWDRDYWYLVGRQSDGRQVLKLWRADRVLQMTAHRLTPSVQPEFDIRELLGRAWLLSAMEQWREQAPVKISLSSVQATRLQQDWYYRHAYFEQSGEGRVVMTFGETDSTLVLELLRWLGPGAELIEPTAWREKIREELQQMLAYYT